MKSLFRLICFLLLGLSAGAAEYDLYFFGGQSNMDGYGFTSDLSEAERKPVDGAVIFSGSPTPDGKAGGGKGIWAPVTPGFGVGFSSDGRANRLSQRFGAELSFARKMRELRPDRKVAIIKYSRGGTSIHQEAARNFGCWEPDFTAKGGINQYDHFLATMRGAMAIRDVDGDGMPDRLIPRGIAWMQGESDAHYTPEIANLYQANLKRLMDLIRAALHADDLPVTIGRISNSTEAPKGKRTPKKLNAWKHAAIVRAAQAAYVKADGNAALMTATDGYSHSDPWHYDTPGYLDMGKRFAEQLHELGQKK
jgi:hypothetical protein